MNFIVIHISSPTVLLQKHSELLIRLFLKYIYFSVYGHFVCIYVCAPMHARCSQRLEKGDPLEVELQMVYVGAGH